MDKLTQQRLKNQPLLTWFFLAIQTIVFVSDSLIPTSPLRNNGVMFGPAVVYLHQYWRFFTPIFFHFGLMHFAVNSVVLYFMGQQIEGIYGHRRFFILYLLAGGLGNTMSFAFNQMGVTSAGSSTSLFGLFGAFVILGVHFRQNPAIQAMVRQFGLFLLLSFGFSFFDQSIDIWGHVGGLLGGVLLGNILGLPKPAEKYSIHLRVISCLFFLFFVLLCVMYGFKKYL